MGLDSVRVCVGGGGQTLQVDRKVGADFRIRWESVCGGGGGGGGDFKN